MSRCLGRELVGENAYDALSVEIRRQPTRIFTGLNSRLEVEYHFLRSTAVDAGIIVSVIGNHVRTMFDATPVSGWLDRHPELVEVMT